VAGAVVYGNIARNMTGVWTVPKTSCRSLTTRGDTPTTSAWVELGVYSVDKVELGAAGVNINCNAGATSFVPYTLHNTTGETDYTGSDTPVQPNDVIVVHVTASVQRVASVTNLTRRWTRTSTVAGDDGDLIGAQFGLQNGGAPAEVAPLPRVAQIAVVSTVASGKPISAYPRGEDQPGTVALKDLGTFYGKIDRNGDPVGKSPLRATVSKPQPLGGFTITRVGP
jgi:hypothetical protein